MEFNATFIVAFASFIVFTVIMNLILYKPLSKIVEARQKFLEEHYNDASEAREKTHAILTDKEQKLEDSKLNAKRIILGKAEEAKLKKAALTAEAQQSANQTIAVAKGELDKSKTDAQSVLSHQVVDLAQSISSKILGENIAVENVDSELISKIMQEG